MSTPAPQLEYAPDDVEHHADRLLRRIVAWLVVYHAGSALLTTAIHLILAFDLVATPPNMSFSIEGSLTAASMAANAINNVVMLAGGVLLLRRSRSSILLLRAAAGASILLAGLGLVATLLSYPTYASYWTTPATFAVNALQFLGGLVFPVAILLLTLPPLARRMV